MANLALLPVVSVPLSHNSTEHRYRYGKNSDSLWVAVTLRAIKHLFFLVSLCFCVSISISCSERGKREHTAAPSVSIAVSMAVVGETAKLMLRLNSPNWHERFVAAFELRNRGIDEGINVLRAGLFAKEWFVRTDALRYIVACEATELLSDVILVLSDKSDLVRGEADRALAALVCVYPSPDDTDRQKTWRKWYDENANFDRITLLREAMLRVEEGLVHKEEGRRIEALMILRGLRVKDKDMKYASALKDTSARVSLIALQQLSAVCDDTKHNDAVRPLLESQSADLRIAASFYLAERGGGEELAWKLHEALLVKGSTERAHTILLKIFGEGPAFDKPVAELTPQEYSDAWKRWIMTDEILKGKRDWSEMPAPSKSPKTTVKPNPKKSKSR